MHADRALAVQVMLGGSNGHAHFLMLLIPGGDDVLQVFPAAVAGFVDQTQESAEIALAQSGDLFCHAVVVGINMEGTQHRAVAALPAAFRQLCKEGVKGHIPQHLAAAHSGHSAAFGGDGGVFVGQVGMVCAGVQNAQCKAGLGEIHRHRLHIGVGRQNRW